MPQIAVNIAPAPSAAPPARQADAPMASEDSYNNQPFDGVLQDRLGDKSESQPLDEASAPAPGEIAAAPMLAGDGKELPPDIAALIAASQPVLAAPVPSAAPVPPATEASPVTAGIAVDIALAQAPLPAAMAALRSNTPDLLLEARATSEVKLATVAKDLSSGLISKGSVTGNEVSTPWPGLGVLLPESASAKPGQPGTGTLAETLSAKDITLLLADARSVTTPTPSATSLVAATSTTSPTTTPAAVPSTPLPFAQPGWEQGLGNRVMWMVNQQVQTAELRMNPAHLGPLEVRISIRDDQATVSFVSAHGQVREALQTAIPQLREMLGNNGLNLADVNISQHSFADTRQRHGEAQPQTGRGQGEMVNGESHGETLTLAGRLGLIDDYA